MGGVYYVYVHLLHSYILHFYVSVTQYFLQQIMTIQHSFFIRRFGRTCDLGSDLNPICHCPPGYVGLRCEKCAIGYHGNPLIPGDMCVRDEPCDPRGSITPNPDFDGKCRCKVLYSHLIIDRADVAVKKRIFYTVTLCNTPLLMLTLYHGSNFSVLSPKREYIDRRSIMSDLFIFGNVH